MSGWGAPDVVYVVSHAKCMPLLQTSQDTVNIEESAKIGARRPGRVHKYMADCALLAGSPLDARELYQLALDECGDGGGERKKEPDRLWYASALEGLCCAGLERHAVLQVTPASPHSVCTCVAVCPWFHMSSETEEWIGL